MRVNTLCSDLSVQILLKDHYSTVKKLKIRTPEKFAVIILKVEQFDFMTE